LLGIEEVEAAAGETSVPVASPAATAAEVRERAAVYRLLSGAFVEEPSREFLDAVRTPDAQRRFAEAGLRLDDDFTGAPFDELAETLAVEYTTLFA
ncbi:MAG TPA: hypothetical protein DHV08_10940, partial [Rhodocyclaceae bacterium]|nr:hypothetical protein [Rhodocyclaceae bacterium]